MQVKTRIPEEKKRGVVYEVPCKRMPSNLHRGDQEDVVKHGDPKNGIAVHAHESNHTIDWEGARVKRSGMTGYWQRTIEAIHIKLNEKTMNLDGGLHLPTVWNPVLNPP